MKKNARYTCVEALLKVSDQGAYSNIILDKLTKQNELDSRDSSFCAVMFYGVLERKQTLDYIISQYSKLPLRKLNPEVIVILHIGLYQLLYMDGVPQTAAVNECVSLSKLFKKTSSSGFINAVLRSFIRDGKQLPEVKGTLVQQLGILYSCPEPLVQLWLDDYGQEATEQMLKNSLGCPPTFIRVNTTKTTSEQLASKSFILEKQTGLQDCLQMNFNGSIEQIDEFKQGLFHVQDKSSQMAVAAMGLLQGQRILDVCGAPGGKAFTIAEYLQNEGSVISCDLHQKRVELIVSGAKRLGLTCIDAVQNDASVYNANLGLFDRVLCDVPCSGFGIIRRKPEIKYKKLEELKKLPDIQYKILEISSKYLQDGGILLYSTCTLNKKENEGVLLRFLERNPDFEPVPLPKFFGVDACYLTLCGEQDTDGFFIGTIRKRVK